MNAAFQLSSFLSIGKCFEIAGTPHGSHQLGILPEAVGLDPMDIETWELQIQESKYKSVDGLGGHDRIDQGNRPDQAKARAGAAGTQK
jgi:hypothetical protein